MSMTAAQVKDLITTLWTRVGTNRVDDADLRTVGNAIVDMVSALDIDIFPDWTSGLTFQTDGSDDGKYCKHPDTNGKKRIWETKTAANIGNEPPIDPLITSNTHWQEISQSAKSGIVEWSAGLFGEGLVVVSWNHSTDGYNHYVLTEPVRPFNSTNIETEIAAGKWVEYAKQSRDQAIAAAITGLWDDRGNYDASVDDTFPASGGSGAAGAILKGDIWTVSVAGTIGGEVVNIGDTVRAIADTPGQTAANWAIGENNIGYTPENSTNKATSFSTVNNTLYPTVQAVANYAMQQVMTSVGDLVRGGTAGAPTRIAAGTNGYVLTMVAGVPAWATPLSGWLTGILTGNASVYGDNIEFEFSNYTDSSFDYSKLHIYANTVDLVYFNSNVTGTETYEALLRFGDDIINRWSRSPGIGILSHYGKGYGTDSSIDGFHFYATNSGYSVSESDLRFRIRTTGQIELNVGSDATGDTYYRNSTGYFTRLAKGAEGTILRAGASVPAYSTFTIPNTISALSVFVANSANVLTEVTPAAGQSIRVNAGGTAWEAYTPSGGGSSVLSDITAASGTNTINNVGYAQEWQWNSLGGATGLKLTSTSTLAASNLQALLEVNLSGANANSTQTTYAARFINTHTGTAATNIAGYFSASGGTNNYAGIFANGFVGIGISAPTAKLHLKGDGTGSGSLLAIEDSGATNRFSLTDDGRATFYTSYSLTGGTVQAYYFNQTNTTGNPTDGAFMRLHPDVRTATGTASNWVVLDLKGFYYSGSASTQSATGLKVSTTLSSWVAEWNSIKLQPIHSISSGTGTSSQIRIVPTYNYTGTYSGTVYGVLYDPTLTSMTGVTHIAMAIASGRVIFGDTSITSGSILLELKSTTTALLLSRVTDNSNISSKVDGMHWYNSTTKKYYGYADGSEVSFLTQNDFGGQETVANYTGYGGGALSIAVYQGTELSDGDSVKLEVRVVMTQSSGTAGATAISFKLTAGFRKSGGTLTQVGASAQSEVLNDTGDAFSGTPDLSVSAGAVVVGLSLTTSKTFKYSFHTKIYRN